MSSGFPTHSSPFQPVPALGEPVTRPWTQDHTFPPLFPRHRPCPRPPGAADKDRAGRGKKRLFGAETRRGTCWVISHLRPRENLAEGPLQINLGRQIRRGRGRGGPQGNTAPLTCQDGQKETGHLEEGSSPHASAAPPSKSRSTLCGLPGAGGWEGTIFCFVPLPLQLPTRAPPAAWPQQLHPRARERRRGPGRAHKGPSALPGGGGHVLQAPPQPPAPAAARSRPASSAGAPLPAAPAAGTPAMPDPITQWHLKANTSARDPIFPLALPPGSVAGGLTTHHPRGPGPKAVPGALTPVPQWLSARFPFQSPSCRPARTRDHVHPVPVPLPLPQNQAH